MYITRHSAITDRRVSDELWELYELGYARIAAQDITRETLYRHEFDEVLADATNRVWVVRVDDRPVSMAVIATDIASTRYLSRAYFDVREPDRMAGGLVHYIMWVVTHPDHQAGRATFVLARGALAVESEEGALLVFDLPSSNQPHERGGGAELFVRLAQMVGDVDLEVHGGSRYYALNFAPVEAQVTQTDADSAPAHA